MNGVLIFIPSHLIMKLISFSVCFLTNIFSLNTTIAISRIILSSIMNDVDANNSIGDLNGETSNKSATSG